MLRPKAGSDTFRAFADNGRRKWAVSWEGHRAFMVTLFDADICAVLDSALARYNGRDEFVRLHGRTGSNLGSGYATKVVA
jgi:hypothetical protein